MDNAVQREINVSGILNAFVYLDNQNEGYKGQTLGWIIEQGSKDNAFYQSINDAIINYPELNLKDYVLVSQSSRSPANITTDLLFACTFKSPEGDYYVVYRGTGDGKWLDNGEGMYKTSTIMQQKAAEYFDAVVKENGLDETDHIIVSGHSKGGNSAQYVTLAAQHASLVDQCYSFNGQGFSKKAICNFQEIWGNDGYQTQIEKMYSINGNNDYVHDLGLLIISPDKTYYVETPHNNIVEMHALTYMLEDGAIMLQLEPPIEQGPVGKFAKKLSEELMKLSEEDLEDCALSIMSLIERFGNSENEWLVEGTGDEKFASIEEFCGLISVGIPLIIKTAIFTEEGRSAVGMLVMDAVNGLASEKNGKWKIIGIAAVGLVCAPILATVGYAVWNGATIIDTTFDLFDDEFTWSDVTGAVWLAKIIMKSITFLLANPQIVVVVLTVVAVAALIIFVVQNWDAIEAFIKQTGNYIAGLAVSLYAWAEGLLESACNLIESAIGKAVELYQEAKQEIIDFGNRLMSSAKSFFMNISQSITDLFFDIAKWANRIFGGATAALTYSGQIAVIISQLDDMQHWLEILRSAYMDSNKVINSVYSVVNKVYYYYNESYVRNCCQEIQRNLKKAEKYVCSTEYELNRKQKILASAMDAYFSADRTAMQDIKRAAATLI